MKKSILILLTFFAFCGQANYEEEYWDPKHYDFQKHNGKTIKWIEYRNLHSAGYDLIIYFTDGTKMDAWSYKYNMRFYH